METKRGLLDQTLESGIEPIELFATPVLSQETGEPVAYRSELRINSIELGVLSPSEFEPVAERTSQCVVLALWNLRRLCGVVTDMVENGADFKWISLRTPPRILTKGEIRHLIDVVFADMEFRYPEKICFEFPRESFFADSDKMRDGLQALRSYGIHTAIRGFGDEFCPTSRLSTMPFDMVLLDEEILPQMKDEERRRSAEALVRYVRCFGCQAIATGVSSDEERAALSELMITEYIPQQQSDLISESALRDLHGKEEPDGS